MSLEVCVSDINVKINPFPVNQESLLFISCPMMRTNVENGILLMKKFDAWERLRDYVVDPESGFMFSTIADPDREYD